MQEMIKVEKEVYEAVLRNSVRVIDLEVENHKLKEINLWHSEKSWDCEKEKQQLKELLRKCRSDLMSCFAVGYEDSEFIKKIDEVLK